MKGKIIILGLLVFFLIGFLIYQAAIYKDGKLHVVFCDVGQGDAIFIRTPAGIDILIDAGPDEKVLECLASHMPLWDRSIELAFATHPDTDHIGGFAYVLETYKVLSYNTAKVEADTKFYQHIQDLLVEKGIPVRFLFAGDTFTISSQLTLKTYWPTQEYVASGLSDDTNSFSLVQILDYNNFEALFTGDVEKETLATLFVGGIDLEVFKIPHHGSKTGLDDQTLQLIKSDLIPISVGKKNRYNHPNPKVLETLKKYKEVVRRTDVEGEIEIVTDGKEWRIIEP